MATDVERIAVLEANVEELQEGNRRIMAKLEDISAELTKYRGFVGGVLFIGGGLLTVLLTFKDYIVKHFFS